MKGIWDFIKAGFSGSSEVSMKRINGTIGYISCTISICCVNPQYLPLLLGTSAALLAAGLLEKDKTQKP